MKRLCAAFFILSLYLISCNSGSKTSDIPAQDRSKVVLHSFTDTTKQDTFKIELLGKKPKEMELRFTITPANGIPVYTKVIRASSLLDNYKESVDLGKEKKQIAFIKEELQLFFAEENFLDPAVTATEEPDKNTPDKNFFAELKRSGVNGFQYRLGKEIKLYIAWSAQEKKVKPYYECCRQ